MKMSKTIRVHAIAPARTKHFQPACFSSRFWKNSRDLTVNALDVFSVLTLKFFICGTLIELYSAWVSMNAGNSTQCAIRSRPTIGISFSMSASSDESVELVLLLLSEVSIISFLVDLVLVRVFENCKFEVF